jgi:hypothetical protein
MREHHIRGSRLVLPELMILFHGPLQLPELEWEVHDGHTDYLFSRHMSVLWSGIPDGVEPQYYRRRPCHRAAVNTLFDLRTPPRDVGRERDRARSNPRIRGNATFRLEQAITPSL